MLFDKRLLIGLQHIPLKNHNAISIRLFYILCFYLFDYFFKGYDNNKEITNLKISVCQGTVFLPLLQYAVDWKHFSFTDQSKLEKFSPRKNITQHLAIHLILY